MIIAIYDCGDVMTELGWHWEGTTCWTLRIGMTNVMNMSCLNLLIVFQVQQVTDYKPSEALLYYRDNSIDLGTN